MTFRNQSCANHPERPASAFCQDCGKPLCPACTRALDGLVLCEPSLALRYPAAAQPAPQPGFGASWSAVPGGLADPAPSLAEPQGAQTGSGPSNTNPTVNASGDPAGAYRPVGGYTPPASTGVPYTAARGPSRAGANPVLAGLLGTIPGVGAMYNGQFIKAFLHVAIFATLVSLSNYDFAGFLIAAWVFYQIFDAAQTAAARRDGTPLPDPLGLLEISRRLGPDSVTVPAAYPPGPAAQPPQPASPPLASPPLRRVSAEPLTGPPFGVAGDLDYQYSHNEPIGAVVLIAVGLLFLMSTLGVFHGHIIGRFWPVLLLALGLWLLVRRIRTTPTVLPAGPAPARRSPFSITPEPPPAPAATVNDAKEDQP